MGGFGHASKLGPLYLAWILEAFSPAHGNADLVAYFFQRAKDIIGPHGALGLIATNTVGQGDTRTAGLQALSHRDGVIFDAARSMSWPGAAAVSVSLIHMAFGSARSMSLTCRLDGRPVEAINSRLRGKPERQDPIKLAANGGCSYLGSKIYGQGFILTPPEGKQLVTQEPNNAERIFPYLGGDEVNTSPTQSHHRYVINFEQMTLDEAERWPELLEIVREKVKPERDENNREQYRKYWWHFGEKRPALYTAIRPLKRCLVTARVTKHLCFSFQPTDRVLNEKLYVFPFDRYTHFAILQSRVHGPWTWLLSSTMKTDLNYSASDCFDTFPFPEANPRTLIDTLEDIGAKLYETRAAFMVDTDLGLTKTYNALKDPKAHDPCILGMRQLHEAMDRAVLDAYGWTDIEVPPFCPMTDADRVALERFEDEVIDRLYLLNAERAAEEKRLGLTANAKKKAKSKSTKSKSKTPQKEMF